MRRIAAATAAASLAVAASLFGALPAAAADTAEVYVVHGVPGLTVDVYVDGALTLDDFAPETVAGPLDLPGGQPRGGDHRSRRRRRLQPGTLRHRRSRRGQQLFARRASVGRRQSDAHAVFQRHFDHSGRAGPTGGPARRRRAGGRRPGRRDRRPGRRHQSTPGWADGARGHGERGRRAGRHLDGRDRSGRAWIWPRARRRSCTRWAAPTRARSRWSRSSSPTCTPPPAECRPAPGRPTIRPVTALVAVLLAARVGPGSWAARGGCPGRSR